MSSRERNPEEIEMDGWTVEELKSQLNTALIVVGQTAEMLREVGEAQLPMDAGEYAYYLKAIFEADEMISGLQDAVEGNRED